MLIIPLKRTQNAIVFCLNNGQGYTSTGVGIFTLILARASDLK